MVLLISLVKKNWITDMRYGPNARTIRKVLMRNRGYEFWGPRSRIAVIVPMSLFPTPAPKFVDPGESAGFVGTWLVEEDGKFSYYHIGSVYSNKPPENALFTEEKEYGGFEWWEGRKNVYSDPERNDLLCTEDLPVDLISSFKDHSKWIEENCKYYIGNNPVQEALMNCCNYSATCYYDVREKDVVFEYSVKWRYPVFEFCSALSRAFEIAGKNGYKLKLIK